MLLRAGDWDEGVDLGQWVLSVISFALLKRTKFRK
jgi:hypothetical protein